MAQFPPSLKKGGTIGIVAPACHARSDWNKKGRALLEKQGYQVVFHAQNKLRDGQLGGPDKARAKALLDMFSDPRIDAIFCARGGNGSIRLLDKLDYKKIKRHPKPLVGFSDITLLLQSITKRCGFVTYHGPMMWNFAHKHDPRTLTDLLKLLSGGKKRSQSFKVKTERPGHAKGILVGGNIALLQSLIGTANDWSGKGSILFLEDTDEPLYRLDRMLRHMMQAGKFKGVKAVLVGEMTNISDGESGHVRKGDKPYGKSLRQIILDVVPENIPLCFDFPCGHGEYLTTLPVGARTTLTLSKGKAKLSFS
ncbi:MAG: LD-carboxypeptidase [Alphaproteobacteria bacterium]